MQTGITRWTPGTLYRNRLFDRFFDQAWNEFRNVFEQGEEVSGRNWMPPVDISETEDALVLYAELPGLSKDDVEITMENNVLSIRGERKFEKETSEENYHRIERSFGSFSRSFTLPSNVRFDGIDASFENGILRIQLPKSEESKPRKIAIK